ncbi:phosphatase PAP2 family protein [Streptomyces sp. NPDC005892]|uniref:phosphatase PAP2 family protein n=1 Tax=Streptomyces sp. NPDC005892 TaxID=3155593 RepID=UPI0033DA881B
MKLPLVPPGRWWPAAALGAAAFALLTALIALRHGAPYPFDESLHRWSAAHRPPVAVTLARGITATGSGPTPYLCAAAAGLVAGRGVRGRLLTAVATTGFLLLAQGVRLAVMYPLARPRPPAVDWATHASGYSFPSGHATTSALTAGLLAWAAWRAAAPAVTRICWCLLAAWAVTVGLTRVYLGVHWFTDVVGGWLLAATCLTVTSALLGRFHREGRPGRPHTPHGPGGRRIDDHRLQFRSRKGSLA